MAGILKRQLIEMILPHMDDPDMWEDPVPECFDGHHDWQMETVCDDLAIMCTKCSLTLCIYLRERFT